MLSSVRIIESQTKKEKVEMKNNYVLTEVMLYEKLRESIMLQSKQATDMMFIAKGGQSVPCHRYSFEMLLPYPN